MIGWITSCTDPRSLDPLNLKGRERLKDGEELQPNTQQPENEILGSSEGCRCAHLVHNEHGISGYEEVPRTGLSGMLRVSVSTTETKIAAVRYPLIEKRVAGDIHFGHIIIALDNFLLLPDYLL